MNKKNPSDVFVVGGDEGIVHHVHVKFGNSKKISTCAIGFYRKWPK
jgi:hypothetical protein